MTYYFGDLKMQNAEALSIVYIREQELLTWNVFVELPNFEWQGA